jgi:hypothetical protein
MISRIMVLLLALSLEGCGGNLHFRVEGVSPPGANGSAEFIAKTSAALSGAVADVTKPLCKSAARKKEVLDGNVLEHNGRALASNVAYQKDCTF